MIARLSRGILAAQDVGLALMLAMVAMIELVSAFTPVVLTEYGRSARTSLAPARAAATDDSQPSQAGGELPTVLLKPALLSQLGGIFDYMAERVRPSPSGSIRRRDLHADYVHWCQAGKRAPLSDKEFFDDFERICSEELRGSIRPVGNRYIGLMLVNDMNAMPAQRMG